MRTREELAAILDVLREASGYSFGDLALETDSSSKTINGWFTGAHLPTQYSEPTFLAVLTLLGIADADRSDWIDTVRRLRKRQSRPSRDVPAPYRGLTPFGPGDEAVFFGRAAETDAVADRIREALDGSGSKLHVLIGASGSGKSSLLHAGVAPALRRAGVRVVTISPGQRPVDLLGAAAVTSDTVVLVDQGEELWTHADGDERARFLATLQGEAGAAVLTLRADFYPAAADEPSLHQALNTSTTVLSRLSRGALHDVIVEPARRYGWSVEPELERLLIAEFSARDAMSRFDVGALPLLSHSLLMTWQSATRKRLTVDGYAATGGLAGAIDKTAEAVYSELTSRQQRIARQLFLRMINVDDERQTRRRVRKAEFISSDDYSEDSETVIDAFVASRILTVEEGAITLSHEAVIGAWSRLKEWVDRDRSGLAFRQRLATFARNWEESGHDTAALLGASRLESTQQWIDAGEHRIELNDVERRYVAASHMFERQRVQAAERRRQNLNRLVRGLAVVSVIALVMACVAWIARSDAERQQTAAELARDEALSRQVASESVRLRATDPAVALHLAAAAYRIMPTVEARSALLDTSAVHTPVRLVGKPGTTLIARLSDGNITVSHADGSLRIVHVAADGRVVQPVGQLGGDTGSEIVSLASSPDSEFLAVAHSRNIELWRLNHGRTEMVSRIETSARPQSLAFTPGEDRLIAGMAEGPNISIWNIIDPVRPKALSPLPFPAEAPMVAVSPDGRTLAAAGQRASLRTYALADPATPVVADIAPDGSTNNTNAIAFSPDGHMLATAMRSSEIRRFQVDGASHVVGTMPALSGFASYAEGVVFSPDGTKLAGVSSDNSTRLWTLATDHLDEVLPGSSGTTSVQFDSTGRNLVTGSVDGTARIWHLPDRTLQTAQATIFQTPTDASGTRLLVGAGSRDGSAHLWDLTDPDAPRERAVLTPAPGTRTTGAVAITADGSLAAVGGASGQVALWDLRNEPPRGIEPALPATRTLSGALTFRPDGHVLVASGQDDPTVTVWDSSGAPKQLAHFDTNGLPRLLSIDRSGRLLAVSTSAPSVEVWDISQPSAPHQVSVIKTFQNVVEAVSFAPDGTTLAAGGSEQTIQLFDVSDAARPQRLSVLTGPSDAVYSLAVSPDGGLIAGAVGSGELWIWDVRDRKDPSRYAMLTALGNRVNDVAFGDGGRLLIGGGSDRIVRLWSTDPERVIDDLCRSGSTPLSSTEMERYMPGTNSSAVCGGL